MTGLQAEPTLCFSAPFSNALSLSEEVLAELGDGQWVEGTVDGFPFRSELAEGQLRLHDATGQACKAESGDEVRFEITRVGSAPEVRVPRELMEALQGHPGALETWNQTTPLARRDWVLWITTAKQLKTRGSRIEKGCDMLASGKKRVCCFGGLNWLTKDHPIETWQPLG